MFKKNQKQFVNIINYDNQIKIDQVILKDNKIIKQNQSTFVSYDKNTMSSDIKLKLQTLQEKIKNTYLITLYDTVDQQLCLKKDSNRSDYEYIALDNNSGISTLKIDLIKYIHYFKQSGIDYLISPFSVLFKLVHSNSSSKISNSLNCLAYNNKLYILILDTDSNVAFCVIKNVTKFEDIKKSQFYDNNKVVHQLYEEIYYLEFEQILNDVVQNYYKTIKNAEFLVKINIFHIKEQLNVEQLDNINQSLMATVSYEQIDIDNILYSMINTIDGENNSFIKPRKKDKTNKKLFWLGIVIVSLLATAGVLYFKLSHNKPEVTKMKIKEQKKTIEKKIKQKPILLPNHINNNTKIIENILTIFDTIAYDGVLKELKIKNDSLTIVANFIINSKSIEKLEDILKKYYKNVQIVLQHNNKANTITNIILKAKVKLVTTKTIEKKEYVEFKFIPIAKSIKYLQKNLLDGSIIRFISQENKEYTKFSFSVVSYIKTPNEFFTMIENLNKNNLDININYPISFTKLDDKIQVKYTIDLYQYNKKIK